MVSVASITLTHARRAAGNVFALVVSALFVLPLLSGCDNDNSGGPAATPTTVSPSSTPTPAAPTLTPTASPTATPAVPNPSVEGPIAGPGDPFVQGTSFALSDLGYSQQEYFISGTARSFTNIGDLASDGMWTVATADSAPFKTRIVVYRPIDPAKFNGSVVVEWLNVTAGFDTAPDWTSAHNELIRQGYIWVGVSAQFIGIEGGQPVIPGIDLSLKHVNPDRYGSLSHPGDSFSYDIFSQAAEAIRYPVGVNPLAGLPFEHIIATGESQSAFRFVTYINAIHPQTHLFDGFLIHSRGGGGAALSQSPLTNVATPGVVSIRADIDVPVLTFETETDLLLLGYFPARQSDTAMFRLWEVPGTSHADLYLSVTGAADEGDSPSVADVMFVTMIDGGVITCNSPINSGPQHFVLSAAVAALEQWVRTGTPPPSAPRMEIAGSPAAFVLDAQGNVLGGIRTPYVDTPVATLSGLGQSGSSFCFLFGSSVPLDAATLAALYPTHDAYVSAVNASTDRAVAAGSILEPDAALIKAAAAESDIGG